MFATAIVPVSRPFPVSVAVSAVARRAVHGVLHDPAGCYTIGPVIVPSMPWGGHFALLAHTPRADHSRERVWTTDETDRPEKAAGAFVAAIGPDAAMAACRAYDERHW